MQSLGPALLLLVLSAPLASSLSVHQEHAWSWPWNRKSAAAKAPEPAATVADEVPAAAEAAPAAEAQATNNTLRSPTEPGCFMRMPSGCPKNPMRTELWRHDVWAEKKGFDEEGCMKRKGVWDGYCESQDAQMVFVAGKVSALQVDGSPSWDQSWPWSRRKAAEAKPADETTTAQAPAAQRASAKVPSQPGCYMRMLSGCPKAPMRTFLWRHDPLAEERGLEEADCLKRKSTWDKHCDSNDAEMVFVSKEAAAAAAAAEAAPAAEAVGPAENATEAAPVAEAQAADPAENATEATPAAEAQAADPEENATEAAASKPLDKEGSVGLLQVGSARWQWPWSKPKRHIIGQEITTTVEPAVTTKAAAEEQQPVASPLQPGCYMRIPTGCPKKSMRTQLWRHDTWAEEQGLDSLACQQRKTVWDKYCETQDALMLFVPKQ
jgi:hypothetical protein